ncbi:MAG: BamA/TamA family outer membrane protein [Bacteriovoracia bacterium]
MKQIHILTCTLIFVLLFSSFVFAQETKQRYAIRYNGIEKKQISKTAKVTDIVYLGLNRTQNHVVDRERRINEGDVFDSDKLEESIRNFWNLNLFWKVDTEVIKKDENSVKVQITFGEKWTLIPLIRFAGTSEVRQLVFGVYDFNTFGAYKEVGAHYQSLAGSPSYRIWYIDPRFLDKRNLLTVDFNFDRRIRILYPQKALGTDFQKPEGGFVLERVRVSPNVLFLVGDDVFIGGGIEFNQDHLNGQKLPSRVKIANQENPISPIHHPDENDGKTILVRGQVDLGRLDRREFIVYGRKTSLILEKAVTPLGDFSFERGSLQFTWFKELANLSNLGFRFVAAQTNAKPHQHLYFLGALESVRGFLDSQFRDKSYLLSNIEFRIPSLRTSWLVINHEFFIDAVKTSNSLTKVFNSDSTKIGANFGAGAMFIIPRIYGVSFRLDYSIPFDSRGNQAVLFGGDYFF